MLTQKDHYSIHGAPLCLEYQCNGYICFSPSLINSVTWLLGLNLTLSYLASGQTRDQGTWASCSISEVKGVRNSDLNE